MTVLQFRQTLFQIDCITYHNNKTRKEVLCPANEDKVVDAFFHARNGLVYCSVYIEQEASTKQD